MTEPLCLRVRDLEPKRNGSPLDFDNRPQGDKPGSTEHAVRLVGGSVLGLVLRRRGIVWVAVERRLGLLPGDRALLPGRWLRGYGRLVVTAVRVLANLKIGWALRRSRLFRAM